MDNRPKTITVPDAGREYFGLSRNAAYAAAQRGDIPTIKVGKLLRVRALEQMLEANRLTALSIPIRSTAPITTSWVNELDPIPVQNDVLSAVALGPARRLGRIIVATKTLLKRSDAQSIFNTLLQEDAAKSLDAAVFSSSTGSGDEIEGLLNNATSVAGTGDLMRDLQALAASVSASGSGQVIFIGGPAFAAAASLDANIKATILGSSAVAETMLIAVDPLSLAWGAGADPDIDVSTEAVLHMSDDPLAIVVGGVASDPTRSVYQTDAVAIRMILPIAFAKRRSDAVAVISGVSTTW